MGFALFTTRATLLPAVSKVAAQIACFVKLFSIFLSKNTPYLFFQYEVFFLSSYLKDIEITVPEHFYYMLGDNSDNSYDSRYWSDYLSDEKTPQISDAAKYMAETAEQYSPEHPLYIVALGAITNVASAMLLNPNMKENAVVVWLGGHALHMPKTDEFNMKQDIAAARVVLDSGVPLVLLEDQDFFRNIGIFRDVYLLFRPHGHVHDIDIGFDAKGVYYDGNYRVFDADGKETDLAAPILWNAEKPYLYTMVIEQGGEYIPFRIIKSLPFL